MELDDANHVVLVNPGDMGNMGTIIRTMLGFNYSNLAIIKPGVDVFDPRVIRASMGALFNTRRTVGRVKDCLKGIFLKDRLPASCAF